MNRRIPLPDIRLKNHIRHTRSTTGFTLLELLVVITIMVVLASLTIPSLTGLASTAGRKGAVNVLLNTFEQARAAALENSVNTYVGFADRNFPDESMRYRAFIVFRDRTEDDTPPAGSPGATVYLPLTKWNTLPRTISIKCEDGIVFEPAFRLPIPAGTLPILTQAAEIPVIQFSSSGAIMNGAGIDPRKFCLLLYEGYFLNSQNNFTRQAAFQKSSAGRFERISFSRFTGRAQLDVTTTQ